MADFFRNSEGEYVCRICNTAFLELSLAVECAKGHGNKSVSAEVAPVADAAILDRYKLLLGKLNAIGAAGEICLSMVEDYLVSRDFDMKKTGRPGPLTMSFSKNAAEALTNLGKLTASLGEDVEKSAKGSDLAAIAELLKGGKL